jgi:hypothetical protein
MDRLDLKVLKV